MAAAQSKTFPHPRIGVLGAGGIFNAHAPALTKVSDLCTVTTVADPNPQRADVIRRHLHQDVRIVADYRDVINDPNIDAVVILLPHHLHAPSAIAAAHAGKPILIEKVMARNVWECDQMIEAADAAGVSLTVCHDRRYDPLWAALKPIVDSGALGEIFFYRLDHNQDVAVPPEHWIYQRNCIGGGAIMSCLTHQIDACRWYGGEVAEVSCMSRSHPARMEGEFLGLVTARMRSGALAELSINWWTRANSDAGRNLWYEMVHICGTAGEIYYMSGRGSFIRLYDKNSPFVARYGEGVLKNYVPLPPAEPGRGHQVCIREWVRHLRGEPAKILTFGRDVRGTVEVAEAAYIAEQRKQTISLPVEPRPWDDCR